MLVYVLGKFPTVDEILAYSFVGLLHLHLSNPDQSPAVQSLYLATFCPLLVACCTLEVITQIGIENWANDGDLIMRLKYSNEFSSLVHASNLLF
jgi:hypothetical protein